MKPGWAWPEISADTIMQRSAQRSTRPQRCGHTHATSHRPRVSCAHTRMLGHVHTCPPVPAPTWPSPGVGPMDGLTVLVTGFTRATASLGTCPAPKRVLRGRWLLRLPGAPLCFCPALAQPDPAPHLRARCCCRVTHLTLQDHQGLLVGVGPLHEHSPAVLPGGLDTESPLPKHRRPPQGTSSSTPIARAQRGADAGAGSQHHPEGGLGPPVPEGSSGPAVCTDSLPKGGWGRASARPADGTPGCAGPPGGRVCRAADLRASGRAPRGGCWYCLTMSLICCVGCGKRSELSVEDRAGSGQREAVAGGRAGARVRPHSQSWPGKPPAATGHSLVSGEAQPCARTGAATGLVGGLRALAGGAGAKGFGAQRRSTGLAGGPVPTNFGRASGARGFCGEQGCEAGFPGPVRLLSGTLCRQEGLGEAQGCPGGWLTSGGRGLGAGLRGCCWSAMACRVISRAWGEVVAVTRQACPGSPAAARPDSPAASPACG